MSTIEREAVQPLVSRKEAAAFLGVKPNTLATWAVDGRYGLPVVKVGSKAMYRVADLEAFIARRTRGATQEHIEE